MGRNQSTGSILASYATAYVSGTSDAGGLAGTGTGTGTASYWDTSTSGRTVGAAGRTMAALQSPTGYTGIYSQWNVVTNCGLPHSAPDSNGEPVSHDAPLAFNVAAGSRMRNPPSVA